MDNKKALKKVIACIFAVGIAISVFCCFVGCEKDEQEENSIQTVYLEVFDNQGNRFYLGKDNTMHDKWLEYEYKNDYLQFTVQAYYESGDKCYEQSSSSFAQTTIPLNKPGEYLAQHIFPSPRGKIFFELHITVKEKPETRPVPIIEILPDEDCISYEMNKKYVYKYNGEWQRPKYFEAYDPEHNNALIGRFEVDYYAVDVEVVNGGDNSKIFIDEGIYKFDLLLTDSDFSIGGESGVFAPARINDIIIEIIN